MHRVIIISVVVLNVMFLYAFAEFTINKSAWAKKAMIVCLSAVIIAVVLSLFSVILS